MSHINTSLKILVYHPKYLPLSSCNYEFKQLHRILDNKELSHDSDVILITNNISLNNELSVLNKIEKTEFIFSFKIGRPSQIQYRVQYRYKRKVLALTNMFNANTLLKERFSNVSSLY